MTGEQVSSHTATGFGAWDGGPPSRQCDACSKGEGNHTIPGSVDSTWVSNDDPSTYVTTTTYLSGVREDGYNDGFGNTFQGVRAYDGNLGQWTSPDAYAGDVDDPMSQRPFMWNRNNPLEYEDPTGYDPQPFHTIRHIEETLERGGEHVGDGLTSGGEALERAMNRLEKNGIRLASRAEHAVQSVYDRTIASSQTTVREIINTFRNGREFHDPDTKNYIRRSSTSGTTVVTKTRGGDVISVFVRKKPKKSWVPIKRKSER